MKKQRYLSTLLRTGGPTPVLNCPDFETVFRDLPLDEQGLLRAVEFVALPDTLFTVIDDISPTIAQVETEDYPSATPLYIDIRFTEESPNAPARKKCLLPTSLILSNLESSLGIPYIWGGNWAAGIPKIADLYPNSSPKDETTYFLRGVDCSGLLYEATQGYTPRNTSELFSYGEPIFSFAQVKPLDIIVWPGHVIICLTQETVIESLQGHGVITSNIEKRMTRIESENFCIRRFVL